MSVTKAHSTHRDEFREVFVVKKTQAAWKELQAAMFHQYKNLMFKVARRYVTLEYTEALGYCRLGFCQGMTAYANKRMYENVGGIHLHAHLEGYMRSACQKAYRDDRNIHIPNNLIIDLEKANRSKLFERDNLTEDEKELKHSLERDVSPFMRQTSLDAKMSDDSDATVGESVADLDHVSATSSMINSERMNLLKEAINKLPERHKLALIHCRGLFGEEEKTYREVGLILGVSHQSVADYLKIALSFVDEYIVDNYPIDNYSYN